jgi:hypothetical protein
VRVGSSVRWPRRPRALRRLAYVRFSLSVCVCMCVFVCTHVPVPRYMQTDARFWAAGKIKTLQRFASSDVQVRSRVRSCARRAHGLTRPPFPPT